MSKIAESAPISPEILAKYEPVIGLEVHAQLLTNTKIFCACSTRFGDAPNANTCPVCLGLPGTLPVLNKKVIEMATRASLALNCTVHEHSRFARKNYFYPDLPKGYQISQFELPLATDGWIEVELAKPSDKTLTRKRIGITRLHVEEDAAKNLHEGFAESAQKAYVDYNRCGSPLAEIVSEPDMRTPEEAYAYLTTLRQILLFTGVSDCNMEEGSLRCDANVSVRLRGAKEFGTKVEVKNLNSFRFLQKALEYEIERHIGVIENGGRIPQETRLWNQHENHTVSMRSKEKAHDYRYFPEPDLLPVHVSSAWREEIRASIPELPEAKRARFVSTLGVTPYDAEVLTSTQSRADYFEAVTKAGATGKSAANWMQTELLRRLNDSGKEIEASPLSPVALAELLKMVESGQINGSIGKKVFATMFDTGRSAAEIVATEGLQQMQDASQLDSLAKQVVADAAAKIVDYRFGSQGIAKYLMGLAMKASRGKANPRTLTEKLNEEIKEQHERAVAGSFLPLYNQATGKAYRFDRVGTPPEPDVIFSDNAGQLLGIEITSTYLSPDEAKWVWDQARQVPSAPVWSSGVIGGVDEKYAGQLFDSVNRKADKTYSVRPTVLVVDFNYPLGDSANAAGLVTQVANKLGTTGSGPFSEIWALWRVMNVPDVRFEIFRIV